MTHHIKKRAPLMALALAIAAGAGHAEQESRAKNVASFRVTVSGYIHPKPSISACNASVVDGALSHIAIHCTQGDERPTTKVIVGSAAPVPIHQATVMYLAVLDDGTRTRLPGRVDVPPARDSVGRKVNHASIDPAQDISIWFEY